MAVAKGVLQKYGSYDNLSNANGWKAFILILHVSISSLISIASLISIIFLISIISLITSGDPHGPLFVPTLFLICINDRCIISCFVERVALQVPSLKPGSCRDSGSRNLGLFLTSRSTVSKPDFLSLGDFCGFFRRG